jgi:hypothetical protein
MVMPNSNQPNIINAIPGFATVGLPGFSAPTPGTFDTYRRISAHPTVALVMRIVTAPVANTWSWAKKADVPQQWLDMVRGMIDPMRASIVADGMRALVYGFAAFEKVWEIDEGRIVLAKLKPLLPDLTTILVDANGNFRGFRQQLADDSPRDVLGPRRFCTRMMGNAGICTAAAGTKMCASPGRRRCRPPIDWRSIRRRSPA